MLPALTPTYTVSLSVATTDQQGVGRPEDRDPLLLVEAGKRGELQDADRFPTQLDQGVAGSPGDESPSLAGTAAGMQRGGDAQRAGLGNRLAQEVDQGIADARIADATRGEKEPLHASA
jgi:hypothetical protein